MGLLRRSIWPLLAWELDLFRFMLALLAWELDLFRHSTFLTLLHVILAILCSRNPKTAALCISCETPLVLTAVHYRIDKQYLCETHQRVSRTGFPVCVLVSKSRTHWYLIFQSRWIFMCKVLQLMTISHCNLCDDHTLTLLTLTLYFDLQEFTGTAHSGLAREHVWGALCFSNFK